MKATKLTVNWDGWVTPDCGIHRTVVPRMPDMSWLGEPPTEREAAAYEVRRAEVIESLKVDLAREVDASEGKHRQEAIEELNALHARGGA